MIVKGRKAERNQLNAASICLLVSAAVLVVLPSSCNQTRQNVYSKMVELERPEYKGKDMPEEKIKEIQEAIKRYESVADRTIEANQQLGHYYKLLAVKYLDREMYGLALESLEDAIFYNPENPVLFQLGAVCSARMAKSAMDSQKREQYFLRAEKYYNRAIELDARYVDALYGLAILYVFELDRPFDAAPLLERVLRIQKKNSDAMFLLARVYVQSRRIEEAIELYETIEETSTDEFRKSKAAANRRQLLEGVV